jgi:diacylglycerol kinase family enzyme
MIDFEGLSYEINETDSETYMDTFVKNLNVEEMMYTEFVIIGGDGLFSQLINGMNIHPSRDILLKMPIGLIPAGSTNALWCSIGGKNVYMAWINVVRGNTIDGDVFSATLMDHKDQPTYLSTVLTFGVASDIVIEAAKYRKLCGKFRYVAVAIKKLACSWSLPFYNSKIEYNYEDLGVKEETKEDSFAYEDIEQGVKSKIVEEFKISERKNPKPTGLQSMKVDGKYRSLHNESDDEKWLEIKSEDFVFYLIACHEAASSVEKGTYMPLTRVNDGNLFILCLKRCSKINIANFFIKFNSGNHLKYKKSIVKQAKEVRLTNPPGSMLWLDGEPIQTSDVLIKLIPGWLRLMGCVKPLSEKALMFKKQTGCT